MDISLKNVPSSKEIADLEAKLAEMKKVREAAKNNFAAALKSDEILASLDNEDIVTIMRKLQSRIRTAHRRVRGNPVPDDLKHALVHALREDSATLSQLAETFNLSISYISRIKKELRDAGLLNPSSKVLNAYEDRQLDLAQPA